MKQPEQNAADRFPTLEVEKLRALLPPLGTGTLGNSPAATPPLRGKVLKMRLGFNPNSSSVGTTVVVFLWSLVASGAVMALTSAVLAHRFRRGKADPSTPGDPTS